TYGISPERVVAVGDARNDTPLIQAAGLGVAMENSMEELKPVADRVIGHHDTPAIAELVHELFL
ncbi:MAG: HAD hydrolase family protein, partial [Planctomycetota bacterium]|nr:HAD hydrolase family protein [Planctomycetota bacterium]